jgi:hypothetical protein
MKTLTILMLLLLLIPVLASSSNYYVIKADGKIYAGETLLKTGDKISEETEIKFTSVKDKLYLLSPDKGNFLIQPQKEEGNQAPHWVTLLKNALPESKYYKTASRSLELNSLIFNDIYDVMAFFREKTTYLPETRYAVNMEKIPLDENNYFTLSGIQGKGDQTVPGIKIIPEGFILTDAIPSDTPVSLEMYYIQPGKKTMIGKFDLVVKSRLSLRNELSVFFNLPGKIETNPSKIYFEQVIPYIREAFGNTHPGMIRDIIRNEMGIALN